MKDFLFVFRNDYKAMPPSTPEETKAVTKQWMDWIGSIAAQNKLTDRGSSLTSKGKVVKANNVITDGPYTEIKELIGGFSIVKAESLEAAVELTKGCPIFADGGNVEVREINVM